MLIKFKGAQLLICDKAMSHGQEICVSFQQGFQNDFITRSQ